MKLSRPHRGLEPAFIIHSPFFLPPSPPSLISPGRALAAVASWSSFMACTPTPTETLYEVLTTTSVSTSFSDIVSTIPPELTTLPSTFCASTTVGTDGNATCVLTQTTEVVSTVQDEEVTTIQSPFLISLPVTISDPTATLFSTCPTSNASTSPPTSPPVSPPSSVSASTTVFLSESSSTLANGSVVVTWVTETSTLPPTFSVVPTQPPSSSTSSSHHNSDIDAALGPIIGGSVGGFVGFIVLATIVWFIWRKRDSFHSLYAKEPATTDNSLYPAWPKRRRKRPSSPPPGPEPKPYQYGLVGRKATPSGGSSPSASPPPTRPQSLAFTGGFSPGPYTPGFSPNLPTPSSGFAPSPYYAGSPPATPGYLLASQSYPSAPARSVTPSGSGPMTPQMAEAYSMPQPEPALGKTPPRPGHHYNGSMASVGTAVSYPYPVFPAMQRDSESELGGEAASASVGTGTSTGNRWSKRMSLTLANWNPETDGELFPRVSEDDESVHRRGVPG